MPPAPRPANAPANAFLALPDPGPAGTLDELVERLRSLKVWAGDPSYEWIKDRVNGAWAAAGRPTAELAGTTTVKDCFRPGRRRLNTELVIAVVRAMHPDTGYLTQWRQALRVVAGEARAAAQVRVGDRLPPDLAGFTGRAAELDLLRRALREGRQNGDPVVISAIAGMAGVGKTQLAVRAAHLLDREQPFDRILFVNLRGFHPDPAQPPADPAAVLDGFLRLLGVPGTKIPHDLAARSAAYRDRLAGTDTLVVLDNAADSDQVRPLVPDTAGCPVLVTSRRSLTDLHPGIELTVDVFNPGEALAFLSRAVPQVPVGDDPSAPARIAHRCGYLPLALGLVAGHIRGTPGWTLTDHADRLDERHHGRRLDTGVEIALDLSYRHLPTVQQRLLRLLALHPGPDFDGYAATALAGGDLTATRAHLDQLCGDHLLQPGAPGRYAFHDLVRAYATSRAGDEDPPQVRHVALTRLFDYYLAATAAATATLHPPQAYRRHRIPPTHPPTPVVVDPDAALTWLDTERPTLIAVVAYTATHGWPTHTTRLSSALFRYLNGGHLSDALTIHGHARHAAQQAGDQTDQAHTLTNLGVVHLWLGRPGPATQYLQQALHLFLETGDAVGQARARNNLGNVAQRLGQYPLATHHYVEALAGYRRGGDRTGQARTLGNLGTIEERLGRHRPATAHYERALALFRDTGDRTGEAWTLNNLGDAEARLGRPGPAAEHLQQALTLFREIGSRTGEAWTLHNLGALHTHLDQPAQATRHHRQALAIHRETGDRNGEVWALNGLGEATHTAGRPADAFTHHTTALTIATDISDRHQQARAHTGLGHAHRTLANLAHARRHYQHALTLYADLGMSDADRIRDHLAAVERGEHPGPVTSASSRLACS
jgi:tetratricopeptide (TPR) repeat protein